MPAARYTESFTAVSEGTARQFRKGHPVSFNVTIGVGTVALKASADGATWDTVKEWTASTTESQSFDPISDSMWYRFDCTADTSGTHTVAILSQAASSTKAGDIT